MTRYPKIQSGKSIDGYSHKHSIDIGVIHSPELPLDIPLSDYIIPNWGTSTDSRQKVRSGMLYTYKRQEYLAATYTRLIIIRPDYRRVGTDGCHSLSFISNAILQSVFPGYSPGKLDNNTNVIIFLLGDEAQLHIEKLYSYHNKQLVVDDIYTANRIYTRLLLMLTWYRKQSTRLLKKFNSTIARRYFSELVANANNPFDILQLKFHELAQKLKIGKKLELNDIQLNMPTTTSVAPLNSTLLDLQLISGLRYISQKAGDLDGSTNYLKKYMEI